jgi:hypothetical protein
LEEVPNLPEHQRVILLEACRLKDRLDMIEAGIERSSSILFTIEREDDGVVEVKVDNAVTVAKQLGEAMAKHLATLRLATPDAKKARAGSPGGQRAVMGHSNVSAIDRARSRGA